MYYGTQRDLFVLFWFHQMRNYEKNKFISLHFLSELDHSRDGVTVPKTSIRVFCVILPRISVTSRITALQSLVFHQSRRACVYSRMWFFIHLVTKYSNLASSSIIKFHSCGLEAAELALQEKKWQSARNPNSIHKILNGSSFNQFIFWQLAR